MSKYRSVSSTRSNCSNSDLSYNQYEDPNLCGFFSSDMTRKVLRNNGVVNIIQLNNKGQLIMRGKPRLKLYKQSPLQRFQPLVGKDFIRKLERKHRSPARLKPLTSEKFKSILNKLKRSFNYFCIIYFNVDVDPMLDSWR